jgi:hypothetical protein
LSEDLVRLPRTPSREQGAIKVLVGEVRPRESRAVMVAAAAVAEPGAYGSVGVAELDRRGLPSSPLKGLCRAKARQNGLSSYGTH